jgi:shikimate kinase
MGSGKTTVGSLLAARAGRPFIDNDKRLFDMTGLTARELRIEQGVDGLHRLERLAISGALATQGPSVIAAAASVVADAETRDRIADSACVIWLDVRPADLARRVSSATHRPLDSTPVRQFEIQQAQRSTLFSQLADIEVDGNRSPRVIVDSLLPLLRDCEAKLQPVDAPSQA